MYPSISPTSTFLSTAQPLLIGSEIGPETEEMKDDAIMPTIPMMSSISPQSKSRAFTDRWRRLYSKLTDSLNISLAFTSSEHTNHIDPMISSCIQRLPSNPPNVLTFLCSSSMSEYFFKFFEPYDLTRIVCVTNFSSSSPIWKRCLVLKLGHNAFLTAHQKISRFIDAILEPVDSSCSCPYVYPGERRALDGREPLLVRQKNYECFKKKRIYFYDFIGLFITKNNARCLYREIDRFVNRMLFHRYDTGKIYWHIFRAYKDCSLLVKIMLIFRILVDKPKNIPPDEYFAMTCRIWDKISLCVQSDLGEGFLPWLRASGVGLNEHHLNFGFTPLMEVASTGPLSIVRELIAGKAHVNAVDWAGKTPLHHAVEAFAKVDVVRELIESKANVHIQDLGGRTALVPALRRCAFKTYMLLLASAKHTSVVSNYIEACMLGMRDGCCEVLHEK